MRRTFAALAVTAALAGGSAVAPALAAAPGTDLATLGRIRDEGFRRSQVMEIVGHLTDSIGPRLTGSPQMKAANDWTLAKLEEWGLANAHLEPWEFGEGWSFSRAEVRMVAPVPAVLAALPKAWTPGTTGVATGRAMLLEIEKVEDLEPHKGQLAGKILFLSKAPEHKDPTAPVFERYDAVKLDDLASYDIPGDRDADSWREKAKKRRELWLQVADLLVAEGVVATVEVSSFEHGVVRVMGGGGQGIANQPLGVPALVMAVEPYERVLRLLEKEQEVELTLDIAATFHRGSTTSWNTLAEIPGSDKNAEVVMAGAHLDSWHAGTGATDNAAGSAVVLEAVRILKALGVKPKRTIRVALWSGEEQGLLGSRAYVKEHFASRPEPTDEAELALPPRWRKATWPVEPKPEHARLAAYFNIDNGGGRVHGIYAQENLGAKMLFERFIEPLAGSGRHHRDDGEHRLDRPRFVRRRRPPRLPVHPGRTRLRHAHAPLAHRHLRAPRPGRHEAGRGGHGELPLPGRDARRPVPEEAPAGRAAEEGREEEAGGGSGCGAPRSSGTGTGFSFRPGSSDCGRGRCDVRDAEIVGAGR